MANGTLDSYMVEVDEIPEYPIKRIIENPGFSVYS